MVRLPDRECQVLLRDCLIAQPLPGDLVRIRGLEGIILIHILNLPPGENLSFRHCRRVNGQCDQISLRPGIACHGERLRNPVRIIHGKIRIKCLCLHRRYLICPGYAGTHGSLRHADRGRGRVQLICTRRGHGQSVFIRRTGHRGNLKNLIDIPACILPEKRAGHQVHVLRLRHLLPVSVLGKIDIRKPCNTVSRVNQMSLSVRKVDLPVRRRIQQSPAHVISH